MDSVSGGRVVGVTGPLATVEVMKGQEVSQNEVGYVICKDVPLKSEIIRIRGNLVDMQVFESTTGMQVGDKVDFSGQLLAASLGPGLLGSIYDGLQNPLGKLKNLHGYFLQRGQYANSLDEEKTWEFTPTITKGSKVRAGHYLGKVPEGMFDHQWWILNPRVLIPSMSRLPS